MMDRRQFLAAAATAPLARVPPPRLSCNLFTFNGPLMARQLTLEAVLEYCAKIGFDAVDPTGYYFPGYPESPPDAYVHQIKRLAFRLGLDISGTGVRNDFAVADEAARKADLSLVERWVGIASKLGAPNLRVFSGKSVPAGRTRAQTLTQVAEALKACARLGAARGVMIALQNHNDFLKTADETLELVQQVGSDWLGLNLDIGSLPTPDPYADIARLAPHAVTWQIKENVLVGGKPTHVDMKKIAAIVRKSGYRGYLPIEILGGGDPRERLPKFLDEVRSALV